LDAYDLPTLFAHREVLESLDPEAPPRMVALRSAPTLGAMALLPGSFNPPTAAHLLLAERARREGYGCVMYVLARRTVDKEQNGLIPEDRLMALRFVAQRAGMGVAVTSAGLYADMADAAAMLFAGTEMTFLVGSDKVASIFDPAYYSDRESALDALFARARLIVAPRSDDGEVAREVLDRPENRAWAHRVSILPLHPAVSDLSSTRVRGLLLSGADPTGLVPSAVGTFLSEVGAFAAPMPSGEEEIDRYRIRAKLIEILWSAREWAERAADLRALVRLAADPGDEGRQLRRLIANGAARAEDLADAQSAAN
jgi:nicotinamide-nucleotide adenylyltransferase